MSLSRALATTVLEKGISISLLVQTLEKYNLLALLPAIKQEVARLSSRGKKDDIIHIESPFDIDQAGVAHIKRMIGNDLAPHVVTHNPSLLAGWRARFRGKLYDGSAERVLSQLITNHS